MPELPNYLKSGERARLIPTVADTSKEGRAVSILLSAMMAVKPFASELLGPIGRRLGKRSQLDCFREVVFQTSPKGGRPDGLIIIGHGKSQWSALIEGKIGRATIEEDQLLRYAEIARQNKIDAVISISNEFAALPNHGPVQLPKTLARHVSLYHWSWMSVLTHAHLLLSDNNFETNHERFILSEVARFLRHSSTGISTYTSMAPAWKELSAKIQTGAPISKGMGVVRDAVASWRQEERDLCLLLSRKLGRAVHTRISRAQRDDPSARLTEDCDELCKSFRLTSTFEIPDTAAHMNVICDFRRRSVTCSMKLKAPEDKKRNSARINWLLRQLTHAQDDRIFVRAGWPRRAADTQCSLNDLRDSPASLEAGRESQNLQSFDVRMVEVLGGKFSSPRKFIELVEAFVPAYYEAAGQHLRAWVPTPPKLKGKDPVSAELEEETKVTDGATSVEKQPIGQTEAVGSTLLSANTSFVRPKNDT